MALKPVDKAAYAVCRLMLAAGAALYARFEQTGEWPNSSPMTTEMLNILFDYIPVDAVPLSAAQIADDPDCAIPNRSRSCFYLDGPNVFRPESRAAMLTILDLRTPLDVRAEFNVPGADTESLEWWATAIAAGALIAVGGLPFAGATVAKIAGYLLGAWALYGFVTPQTPGGKSLAQKWAGSVGEGFEKAIAGVSAVGKVVVAGGVVVLLWAVFGRRR